MRNKCHNGWKKWLMPKKTHRFLGRQRIRVRYALAVTLRRSMQDDGAGSEKVIEHFMLDKVEKSAISYN